MTPMLRLLATALAIGAFAGTAIAVAGCGGEPQGAATENGGSKPTIRNADPWTVEQIEQAASLTTEDEGLSWQTPSGCNVAVILTSSSGVELYAGAGDPVATNPDGSAGVKFDGTAECGKEFSDALASLK